MSPEERAEARARLDAANPHNVRWLEGICSPDTYAFAVHAPIDLAAALDTIDALEAELANPSDVTLTAIHLAIENVLIEHRDNRISMPLCANGLVVREADGQGSEIIRIGTRVAIRLVLREFAALNGARDA